MAKEKKGTIKYDPLWAKAKKLCRLNADDVRKAKELGMNPRTLMKNIPSPTQQWKAPVKFWIRDLYEKRQEEAAKKKKRREERERQRLQEAGLGDPVADKAPAFAPAPPPSSATAIQKVQADFDARDLEDEDDVHPWLGVRTHDELLERAREENWTEDETFENLQEFSEWERYQPPGRAEIEEQRHILTERQKRFREIAEVIADAFAQVREVSKVALFGSVVKPLQNEVPRFSRFRNAGIEVPHECKDLDLAVWVTDTQCAERLRRALVDAVKEFGSGIATHQVDVFLFDSMSGLYEGRLCIYNKCPKGKLECHRPGCGEAPFVAQHEGFKLRDNAIAPGNAILLYEGPEVFVDFDEDGDDLPF